MSCRNASSFCDFEIISAVAEANEKYKLQNENCKLPISAKSTTQQSALTLTTRINLHFAVFTFHFSIRAVFVCVSGVCVFLEIGMTAQFFGEALHLIFGGGVAVNVAIFLSITEVFH